MHTVLILNKTLSINTAYMFHSMHSLYSPIQCILETNFSYVLCRWMIDEMILVLDEERVQFVLWGGGHPLYLALGDQDVLGGEDVTVLMEGEADSSFGTRL